MIHLLFILFIFLFVLKVLGLVAFSWLWVFAPLIAWTVAVAIGLLLVLIAALGMAALSR